MALYTTKGASNVPNDAIKVSKETALAHQKQIIRDWEEESKVFFLRYGGHIASGMTLLTSFIIIKHFKKQFNLADRTVVGSYFPISGISAFVMYKKFESTITDNTLIMKMKCPLCTQMRYIFQQTTISIIYPSVTSCILFSFIATRCKSLVLPDLTTNYKDYFHIMYKFTKNGSFMFKGFLTFHVLLAFFLPYMQRAELTNITQILQEIEERDINIV